MPRILGVDIPNDKRTVISLRYIYGIGPYLAEQLCERTGIDPDKRARDLTRGRPGQAGLASGQRVRGGGPAPSPGSAEHRPAARHRLLSRPAAPQGSAGSRPADAHQRADPEGPTQDGRRQEGRQGTARVASGPGGRSGATWGRGRRVSRHPTFRRSWHGYFQSAGTSMGRSEDPGTASRLPGSRREWVPETRGMIVNEPRTTRVLIGSD